MRCGWSRRDANPAVKDILGTRLPASWLESTGQRRRYVYIPNTASRVAWYRSKKYCCIRLEHIVVQRQTQGWYEASPDSNNENMFRYSIKPLLTFHIRPQSHIFAVKRHRRAKWMVHTTLTSFSPHFQGEVRNFDTTRSLALQKAETIDSSSIRCSHWRRLCLLMYLRS